VQVECLIVNKRSPDSGGQFLEERHAQEAEHLKLLDEKLPSVPRQEIELMAHDVVGLEELDAFSRKLG
jgi:arsenite-transporting ATPase